MQLTARRIAPIVVALALLYWGLLFTATHLPGGNSLRLFPGIDKVLHATAYGMLAILLLLAISIRVRVGLLATLSVIAICATYGILDELSQQFVPRRTADFYDWIADVTGSLIGCGLFFAARAVWAMLRSPKTVPN